MKFMKQEGDIPLESNQLANLDGGIEEWIEQYTDQQETNAVDSIKSDNTVLNKVEEELQVAGSWIDEFVKENPSAGILLACVFFLINTLFACKQYNYLRCDLTF